MWQAMPRDSHGSLALLVEGIPQAPINAEFYSAAARPMDAFSPALDCPGQVFLF